MTTDSSDSMKDTLPIGPLQEGIWLFWRLNQASPAYMMPEIFHFEGEFDTAAVEFAFNEVIRRHESLRTTFRETDSGVVQVIARDPEPVPVHVVDLRGLPEAERSGRLQATIDAASNRPFDLATEPAIRLTAVQVTDSRTTLALVVHHIACDGISMTVVLDEFGELYRSARRGTPPDLAPVPRGYSTFVQGQLAALADGTLKEEEAYWRERLAGVTGSVLPGIDHAVTRAPTSLDTAVVSLTLDDQLAESLSAYARRTRSTQFSVLLSTMKVMIAAATGDGVKALGMATSGRTPEFARTVGMLANMIVIQSRIDLSRTFTDTLDEVSLDLMDAIDHQALPFSRMVTDLNTGQDPGAGIVRMLFSAGAVGRLKLGEGKLSEVITRTVQGPFDMYVACDISPSGIALDWEYALRTYSPELAQGYCAAYHEVLATLLRQPDVPMASLGLTELLARVAGLPHGDATTAGHGSPAAQPDRSADTGPAADAPDSGLTPVEEAVAAIWSEAIRVPVESPYDDFFELGGHSLKAGAVVASVRKRISRTATLRLLFDHPQLRDFASRLDVGDQTDGASARH
ncbi:condensation domain-containing protein [Streptomyces radicis]|uniref:Carrier domain-containing protein n=1 Tax=Streptomyces radicis TaxID=1750517 RepID=A0A3A9W344_9ACTN|nr:condensation domain-containing protein [Streptomyces radicis]RKN07608.1 hypothetical protein D7319_18270 [Streptomyces radicis]RKN18331.1 hypothetical protein D7318_22505 [Streptomyces radicis]